MDRQNLDGQGPQPSCLQSRLRPNNVSPFTGGRIRLPGCSALFCLQHDGTPRRDAGDWHRINFVMEVSMARSFYPGLKFE